MWTSDHREGMLSLAVIIVSIRSRPAASAGPLAHHLFQLLAGDSTLGGDALLHDEDRHAPLEQAVQAVEGIEHAPLQDIDIGADRDHDLLVDLAHLAQWAKQRR